MKKLLIICLLAAFTFSLAGSALAAAAVPTLKSQTELYNLFKKDLGNRWGSLNSDSPKRTGSAGVYEYFIGDPTAAVPVPPLIKFDTDANAATPPLLQKTLMERLNWYKAMFIAKVATTISASDKAGIEHAMKSRLLDVRVATFQAEAEVKTLVTEQKALFNRTLNGKTVVDDPATLAIDESFKSLITTRREAIALATQQYKDKLKVQTEANPDYTDFGRYLANLTLLEEKDHKINTAWTNFYASVTTALDTARAAYYGLPKHGGIPAAAAAAGTLAKDAWDITKVAWAGAGW